MFRYSFALLWFLIPLLASGALLPHTSHGAGHGTFQESEEVGGRLELAKRADKVPLRILPLGASIVYGLLSSKGNGFRKPLRDQLRFDGWQVNMVGTKANGNMADKEVEAHSGDTIDEVKAAARLALRYKANCVLLNAGTNDANRGLDIPHAGDRMRSLIESILSADGMQDATIILSTLIPSHLESVAANRPEVNRQYRDLVVSMRAAGVSIVLADMDPPSPARGNGWLSYPEDYTTDGVIDPTHPNDEGYRKMAYVWYKAILDASDRGFLKSPEPITTIPKGGCANESGGLKHSGGLTQPVSGEEDGIYYHSSEPKGIILTLEGSFGADVFFFARLFSRDQDDLLVWKREVAGGPVRYEVYRNTRNPSRLFANAGLMSVADNCIPRGVRFIDLNGDGLDDFVCIGQDGTAFASINNGDGGGATLPTFRYVGKIKDAVPGYLQARVRLGDVDGDGRADYCVIADNGDITCWRNGGMGDVPQYWQPLGKRFTGKGGDLAGIRFEDINGDGRDDWLWVRDDGQTTTWTNYRSCAKGQEGDGLNIAWRQGFSRGSNSGPTHGGMGGFASSGLRDKVHFARIYGEPQDFGLLGRLDYVFIEAIARSGRTAYNFHVWKNVGGGGTKVRADGNRYCNMMGHSNGMMDYVWILSKGDMRIYPNRGVQTGGSYWGPSSVFFDPSAMNGRDIDRRDLHLIDWDGDGACDIVWTDPLANNRPRLWRNRIKETGNFNWEYHENPAPALHCPERRGVGFFDRPVHFADISGNGKADFLCVEKDGRSWGFLQGDNGSWEHIDQYKFSEGKDRANLQWADVDGDGRADMIHTNKFNGDGTVWYNRGRRDVGGSRFEWAPGTVKFSGASAGSCEYFPDLDGDGRADLHVITNSLDNTGETWFTDCGLVDSTGDDGRISDPRLPIMP